MTENLTGRQSLCPPETSARRAKIICTIGPSCGTEAGLRELMQAGMDVARLNFSHGSPQDHIRRN
jgi:pyruvate kinase